jgi:hypothetical protein
MPMAIRKQARDYPSIACFFPLDEGSGTEFSDVVRGVTAQDGSATHAVAHAATFAEILYASPIPAPDIPANKSAIIFVCYGVVTSVTLGGFTLGHGVDGAGNSGIALTSDKLRVKKLGTATAVGTSASASTATTDVMLCGTFNGSTGEIRFYQNDDGAGMVFIETADASSELGGLNINNQVTFGSIAQNYYGAGLILKDSLPSDAVLIAAMDSMRTDFLSGRKLISTTLLQ